MKLKDYLLTALTVFLSTLAAIGAAAGALWFLWLGPFIANVKEKFGWLWDWWTSPIDPPLPYQDLIPVAPALPPDYTQYWGYVQGFGFGALVEGGLIIVLLMVLILLLSQPRA